MSDIHQRIKALREDKKLSMEALGKAVGVSFQAVQQWEQPDGTAPRRTRLTKVAKALDTSEEYLQTGRHPGHNVASLQDRAPPSYCHSNPNIQTIVSMLEQMTDIGIGMITQATKDVLRTNKRQEQRTQSL